MELLKSVDVYWQSNKVGRIALADAGMAAFEYDKAFLKEGVSISPFEIPLKEGVFFAKRSPFYGNFGVFDDCLPDGWGLLILDRYLQQTGLKLSKLSLLDRLCLVGTSGRGALEFFPDRSVQSKETIDIEALANEAAKIISSDTYEGTLIESLYKNGGSPGGARPKVFLHYEGKEWLVKFPAVMDSLKIGVVEYNYSLLAKKCGIEMPETCLFKGKYFGVERFDRLQDGTKLHVVSVAGLLNADYRVPCIDYHTIFQVCQALTRNVKEMWKVYRLMVFNYLIGNKDDHAKNFAFIFSNKEWHFSPAYDVLPSEGMNGYHTTSINDSINPTKADLITLAKRNGLEQKMAMNVYEEIETILHSWKVDK